MRSVHHFTKEQLKRSKKLTPDQIARTLEDFRLLSATSKSRLISMRVPERMLEAFKTKARNEGLRYQVKLKQLMQRYLDEI